MTDKVQKIREEVVRLKEETSIGLTEHENGVEQGRMEIINAIFLLLDSMQEEPVSEDFEVALEKKVREAQDWTYIEEEGGECPLNEEFGADDLEEFARWGADWVRNNKKEPVSEDFKDFEVEYFEREKDNIVCVYDRHAGLVDGAQWQKQQMLAKAVDAVVKIDAGGYPYVDATIELYDYLQDIPLAKEGDKYKVILIKED